MKRSDVALYKAACLLRNRWPWGIRVMNVKKLAQGLSYAGDVEGKKQSYHIFRGTDFYLVMSFSATKPGGNFNIVDTDAVEYVLKRFAGAKSVTSADVVEKANKTRHAPDAFA